MCEDPRTTDSGQQLDVIPTFFCPSPFSAVGPPKYTQICLYSQPWYRKSMPFAYHFSTTRKIKTCTPHECKTRSSAVAERPCGASCLSVVSFNIPNSAVFLLVTAASDLLVHKILLNSVLLSPIVFGGVRPKPPDKHAPGHNPLVFCRSCVRWGQDHASWVG